MSRTGLRQFGVMPPTVVREPTRDGEDIQICPECGHPVVKSKGSQRIEKRTSYTSLSLPHSTCSLRSGGGVSAILTRS